MRLGDFAAGAVIDFKWNTISLALGSITRATNGNIRIYKDNSLTQRTSVAGITDTEDFDGLTGLHHLRIDTSDNTDPGFYAAGHDYQVVLEGAVIDGLTINAVLAFFSLNNRPVQGLADNVITAAKVAADVSQEIRTEMDANSTKLANLDVTVGSRLSTAGYTAPDNAGIAAIKAKTDNLPATPAATGDAMSLTAAAVDAIHDEAVDGTLTLRQSIRLINSALFGKVSGAQTLTVTFRDVADSLDRIVATVDVHGNRNTVVRNVS